MQADITCQTTETVDTSATSSEYCNKKLEMRLAYVCERTQYRHRTAAKQGFEVG